MIKNVMEESNLIKALSWVSETDRTEFQCCLGQWILHVNAGTNDFNLADFRPIVKVLFYLYLSEHEEDF